MSRSAYSHLACWLVCVAMIGGLTASAYALDEAYNFAPYTYYDPVTKTKTPYFAFGWYTFGANQTSEMHLMKASGSNTVHITDMGVEHMNHYGAIKGALDKAEELGMKVIVNFSQSLWGDPSDHTELLGYINTFKNHPALLSWGLGDEVTPGWAGNVNAAAIAIKAADPNHQVSQVHHPNPGAQEPSLTDLEALQMLMENTDIASYCYHNYMNASTEHGTHNALLSFSTMRADQGLARGWGGNVRVAQACGVDHPTNHLNIFRFQTADEYRWDTFAHLASVGAKGFLNWIYTGHPSWYPDPKTFPNFRDNVVGPVFEELAMIKRGMETGYNLGTVNSNYDSVVSGYQFNKISHLLLYDDLADKYYLIVTNNEPSSKTIEVDLANLPMPLDHLTAEVPKDARTVQLTDQGAGQYHLTDTLDAWGVNVYSIAAAAKAGMSEKTGHNQPEPPAD